jgi:hypothetical protein
MSFLASIYAEFETFLLHMHVLNIMPMPTGWAFGPGTTFGIVTWALYHVGTTVRLSYHFSGCVYVVCVLV